MSGLCVRDLVVRFGDTAAVDGVSLRIEPGTVFALLGPSGCGKSTLLRAVAGLEPVAAGSIRWDGRDLTGVPVHRRGFGLMFQDGQLFPALDVCGNVEFGLRMARLPRAERKRRVAELLDLVGLAGYQRRAVATLSGGEQQRVSLARSLAPRPRLLLLDEPLSSLDRVLRERLSADLSAILTRTDTTALYVTHDHDEAFTVGDQVAVMHSGRLLQTASPDRLWRRPADRAVAAFLGYRWFAPVGRLDLDGAGTAALRSESLVVDPDGSLTGRVLHSRFARGGTTVRVVVDDLGEVEARTPGVEPLAVGDTVRLRVEPSAVGLLP